MKQRSSNHSVFADAASDTTRIDQAPDRYLTWAEVCKLTGLSKTTLWREIRAGRFFRPVALSPNRKGFRASDYANWTRTRAP